mmetsp:Transcript_33621/g.52312  ORF Transcript_33621/g.52312 Transcript_33621/m.52312 type:complete len:82 (-) Transcript_33621:902-1147(-)
MSRYRDTWWDADVPVPIAAVMCGATFFMGYRFREWVYEKTEQWKKVKTEVSKNARVWTFRAAELCLVASICVVAAKKIKAR